MQRYAGRKVFILHSIINEAENEDLKQVVAELTLKTRMLKKLEGFGVNTGVHMKYNHAEKYKIIRMAEDN